MSHSPSAPGNNAPRDDKRGGAKQGDARLLLLEAAADTFSRAPNATVRDIAALAGVNHGLVHYYFGSKEKLKRDAFDHIVQHDENIARYAAAETPEALLDIFLDIVTRDPRVLKMAVLDLLEDRPVLLEERGFPSTVKLVELAVPHDATRSRFAASFITTTIASLITLQPWLLGFGQDADDAEFDMNDLVRAIKDWHLDMIAEERAAAP